MNITIRPGGTACCPMCQEAISRLAKKCPHCHSDLSGNAEWIAAQKKGGCALMSLFACLLVLACIGGCIRTAGDSLSTVAGMPDFVVRQYPDYPSPGQTSRFPGGLVAAFWKGGRIVRPATNVGGDTYHMGMISPDEARSIIKGIEALRAEDVKDDKALPVDAASQTIAVHSDSLTSRFQRTLPGERRSLQAVQDQLKRIDLPAPQPIPFDAIRRLRWYGEL